MQQADLERFAQLAPQALLKAQELLREIEHKWKPFPDKPDGTSHPQRLALESEADILGYGGAAGGGKSDLLLGVAGWNHYRSIIFRRVFPSLRGIVDRSREIYNPEGMSASEDTYNESMYRWRFPSRGGAQVQFGSLQYDKDVLAHQGQPRDLHGFDELTEFTEYQFRYIIGWNRTGRPRQRCRVICTMNPPTTKEGEWVIRFFAPWLDPMYTGKRAKEGELRWFTTIGGKDVEMSGPDDITVDEKTGDHIYPKSRTFISARIQDNPVLMASGYMTTLQSLPEPLRSKLLYGDFMAGVEEDPWQLFPSDWVKQAQARWMGRKEPKGEVDQLGIDVARGGRDNSVFTPRKGNFFCTQKAVPGALTKDGAAVLAHAVPLCTERTRIGIDVVAVGTSPFDLGRMNKMNITPLNGAEGSKQKAKAGKLAFYNKRAEWHWKLREDLDPESGMDLAIPADNDLLVELTAIKWEITVRGIKVRDKEETKELIGRSPDKAESLIYAHAQDYTGGASLIKHYQNLNAADKKKADEEVEAENAALRPKAFKKVNGKVVEVNAPTVAEVAAMAPKRQVKRSSNFLEATGGKHE